MPVLFQIILLAIPLQTGWGQQKALSQRAGFNLFSARRVTITANRVQCGIDDQGNICRNTFGSPTGGGGFWPKNTPNQYIFNSGLQIAGIIPLDAGFEWAGDTTGARFFTNSFVNRLSGEARSSIFSSSDPQDLAEWPTGALIHDLGTFHPALLGRKALSDQDTWVRYWDGNPALGSARDHPMGLLIEQRTLSFNHPVLNEDIIYLVFTFFNITAADPATYSRLPAAIQPEIARIGADFQNGVLDVLGTGLPDGGFTIDSIYAAIVTDFDVGNAGTNASSAFLPFNMGFSYKTDFNEPTWFYPSDINGSPFGPRPGFVAVVFLKTPGERFTPSDLRLAMYSDIAKNPNFAPGTPSGPSQMWRFFSGNHDPLEGDPLCPVAEPRRRRLCLLEQFPNDTRFRISTGPFSLAPGEAKTLVLAYVFAAPVAAPVLPFVGGTLAPGIPPSGREIFNDPSLVRVLERAAGWAGQNDDNGNGVIEANEVVTVERSLLHKAQIAQSLVDSKFLLPSAPEAPDFFLIPGDDQVTVVWDESDTERLGDPYFVAAGDPLSVLYDPNYRQFDVEGYRIYRGPVGGEMELIAQFDYQGTSLVDFTGAWDYGTFRNSRCAPELGPPYDAPPNCPVDFTAGGSLSHDLAGVVPQVRLPGRVAIQNGTVLLLPGKLDSAFVPPNTLRNSGVPFAFIDREVTNGVRYEYAVTAFDVNSVNSGPSSLESAAISKVTEARAPPPTERLPVLVSGMFGDDGVELVQPSPSFQSWVIDPETGRFEGPPPPTDQLTSVFEPLIPELLPAMNLTATIDSLTVARFDSCPTTGGNALGSCYFIWVTFDRDGTKTSSVTEQAWGVWSAFGDPALITTALGSRSVPADLKAAARFGIPAGVTSFELSLSASLRQYIQFSSFEGQSSRRGFAALNSNLSPGGSRWFEGADETVDHPASSIRVGHLSGVDTIWAPIHHTDYIPDDGAVTTYSTSGHMQCFGYMHGGLGRQADVRFTWGARGTIRSVRDLTHHVDVPFKSNVQASYGFLDDNNGDGVLSWRDFDYIQNVAFNLQALGFCNPGPLTGATGRLKLNPVVMDVSTDGNTTDAAVNSTPPTTGTGFGLYVNGHRFIFQLSGGRLPPEGTEWTLRSHHGIVGATNDESSTPTAYTFSQTQRSPIIPGLNVRFTVDSVVHNVESTGESLELVHTVPDPYYISNVRLEPVRLSFVNLPPRAIIRIYSVSGVLVQVLEHNRPDFGGDAVWNVRTRTDRAVASGVYFYHIETPEGLEKVGRFTIVNASGVLTGGDLTR